MRRNCKQSYSKKQTYYQPSPFRHCKSDMDDVSCSISTVWRCQNVHRLQTQTIDTETQDWRQVATVDRWYHQLADHGGSPSLHTKDFYSVHLERNIIMQTQYSPTKYYDVWAFYRFVFCICFFILGVLYLSCFLISFRRNRRFWSLSLLTFSFYAHYSTCYSRISLWTPTKREQVSACTTKLGQGHTVMTRHQLMWGYACIWDVRDDLNIEL